MSKKIGIVSEGVSDYYVLKHIISRYLKEQDVYTIPLNPKQDKGKQVGFSGWQGVLNYISGMDEKYLFVESLKGVTGDRYLSPHVLSPRIYTD